MARIIPKKKLLNTFGTNRYEERVSMDIKISVVVPVYNSEKYLQKCVDSLLDQTYSNIEVILVDDGSTDSSPQICDNYATSDRRVTVIHQKNARIGAARNRGLEVAHGDYITFIDSDDYLERNAYETCVDIIRKHKPDIIQWDLTFVPEGDCKDVVANREQSASVELVLDRDGTLEKLFQWKNMDSRFNHIWTASHCIWTKMCRIELFDGVRFPVGKEYEDEMILHKIMFKSRKSVFINARFSNYLLRGSSTVHTMPLKGRMDKLDAFMDRYELMKQTNSEALMEGITHDSLALIFNNYLQAHQEKNKEAINKLNCCVRKLLKERKGHLNCFDGLVANVMLLCPAVFVLVFGKYRKVKS